MAMADFVDFAPGIRRGEDTHTLRLSSELAELRVGYVNRHPCALHCGRQVQSEIITSGERFDKKMPT